MKEILCEFIEFLKPYSFNWDSEEHKEHLINKFIETYQPESSKREDLLCPTCNSSRIEHVIRAGNFPVVYCHDCKDEVMEEDLIRCGTPNPMET